MDIDLGLFEGVEGADELLAQILGESAKSAETAEKVETTGSDDASAVSEEPAPPRHLPVGTLFIDADACPVIHEALAEARRARVPVVIAGNTTQNLERHIRPDDPCDPADARLRAGAYADGRPGFWVDTLVAGVGPDSADFAIVERLQPGDVVVTQDIGLAGMCLGRGAAAIGVRGRVYDRATIDAQLFIRHEEKKARRHGMRTAGPAPFTDEDRRRFSANLRRLLER